MISIDGVSKRFGARLAVHELSLEIPAGCVFGLLGHNGAGKSTLIGMLLGQVFPDTGRITIAGHDVFTQRRQALRHVGAIFEAPAFYNDLSGWRNLQVFAAYTGPVSRSRMDQVVGLCGLSSRIHDRVAGYSHGMRQRLAMAQALLPDPKLLILDEPSDGLDPEGIREMRELMTRLNREWGLTVVLSSHLLGEVEQLCTHLGIIREGRLCYAGPWDAGGGAGGWVRLRTDREGAALSALREAGLIDRHEGDRVHLAEPHTSADLVRYLVERGVGVHMATPLDASLEAFYLKAVEQCPGDAATHEGGA